MGMPNYRNEFASLKQSFVKAVVNTTARLHERRLIMRELKIASTVIGLAQHTCISLFDK